MIAAELYILSLPTRRQRSGQRSRLSMPFPAIPPLDNYCEIAMAFSVHTTGIGSKQWVLSKWSLRGKALGRISTRWSFWVRQDSENLFAVALTQTDRQCFRPRWCGRHGRRSVGRGTSTLVRAQPEHPNPQVNASTIASIEQTGCVGPKHHAARRFCLSGFTTTSTDGRSCRMLRVPGRIPRS